MKVEVWLMTDKVGSKCTRVIDIPDEDVEGLSEADQESVIDDYAYPEAQNMMSWGRKRVD